MNLWREVARTERENGARTCRVVNAKGEKDKNCNGHFEQSHHGIWASEKSKTAKEWRTFLDSTYNFCPSCSSCNISRVGDGSEARWHYFQRQVNRYGKAQMSAWLQKAPQAIKDRHEWRRYMSAITEVTF